jgi:hypothetical protein
MLIHASEAVQAATLTSQPMEVPMSLTPNARRRQAFLWGRQNALRSTSNVVDQLQAELIAEREQHAFDVAEMEKQLAVLSKELLECRLELAKRRVADAFAAMPSPSPSVH